MKWKERVSQNRWQLAVLLLVLVAQCFFISQKQGYHMDELLTFELGNAEYNPWIVPTQPVGRLAKFMQQEIYADTLGETLENLKDTVVDVLQNRGGSKMLSYRADVYEEPVWITGKQFHEYITVGERDGFNYLSVYFNVKDDNHPPLYFMLVHTASSLFRDKISPWMGCIFNLAAVMGCCILMFSVGRLLAVHGFMEERSGERWGLCCALLYGCSSGAIATALFVRMYGVMTFFCVLTLYLHLRKWLGGQSRTGKDFTKENKLLILVTALGFWTQYFFLFYCLLLALVTVFALFCGGRKKEAFCYIRSMAIAAVIGVGVYPFGVKHILTSGRGVEAIGNLMSGLTGYGERLLAFGGILVTRIFGQMPLGLFLLALLLAGTAVLLFRRMRDRDLFQRGAGQGTGEEHPGDGRTSGRVNSGGRQVSEEQDRAGSDCGKVWWMLALPPLGYFLLAAKMSPYMVDRYIMPVFPFGAMAVAGLLEYLFRRAGSRGGSFSVYIAMLLALVNVCTYDGEYLYRGYGSQLDVSEKYADLPCICIYEGYGFYDNLLEFENYGRTLLVKPDELAGRQDISELPEAVVLIKSGVWSQGEQKVREVQEILSGYGLKLQNMLIRESVYGDRLLYYVNEE